MGKIKPTQDGHNANRGTARGRYMLEESLRSLGAGRSIVLDKNGVAIAGNKTLEVAQELGLDIEFVHTSGDKLVAVVRDDLDLKKDATARELAYADNRVGEVSLDWDLAVLAADVEQGIDVGKYWFDDEMAALLGDAMRVIGEPTEQERREAEAALALEDGDPDDITEASLLSLLDVTIAEPRHHVQHGDVWRINRHILVCANVMDQWDAWAPFLKPGTVFCPYPGPMVPMTIKAQNNIMLMVQPSTYICGHILDRWEDVYGAEQISRD